MIVAAGNIVAALDNVRGGRHSRGTSSFVVIVVSGRLGGPKSLWRRSV